jgi:DNA-binding response OmpR family regulator
MKELYFESLYPQDSWFEEIEKLSDCVKKGGSTQLISIPGAGRATVFGLLARNKKIRNMHFGTDSARYHFVLIGFDEIRGRSLFDVTKFIFLALADSLNERGFSSEYQKINNIFKEGLRLNDELVLFQRLKDAVDFLTLSKNLNLVFLMDRFEEYVPSIEKQFFANLKHLRKRAKYKFSVIFSLNRPLESMLDHETLSDFYEFIAGNHIYMPLFDKETTKFRVSYIEEITGKKIPDALLEEIMQLTGGVGKLIKLSAEAVLAVDSGSEIKAYTAKGLDGLKDFLLSKKTIQEALSEICRSLLPSEQAALIRKNYADPGVVEYLERIGLLKDQKIQIPLFDEHIKSHAKDFSQKSQKIIFDKASGSIMKGDVMISDQLTGSEFRLLSFLLETEERIVTRDEIIDATWSDLKSTEGITDQALDQLIFRIRRKIEDDPNHPAHLLTVKGRGFKFVA